MTVCVHGNALTVLNVGDSRAIVGSVDKSGRVTVSFATEDQKPDTPAQKARSIKAGGRVFAVTYDDGVDGPARMAQEHGRPGACDGEKLLRLRSAFSRRYQRG